ncbi:hypothetical protein RYZ27_07000 [Hyphomonas sp. FCG-A18]|uniref:hypothetical protein n=1 Tax=Hyphomonas sp. FCG-A18 TaxID=3080019 RepID=UPI002B30DB70|nr:hypothetical protein RYZ27_07000 [Hyphomonas sp. FCG-A18]
MRGLGTICLLALLQLHAVAAPWHAGDGSLYAYTSISQGEVENLKNIRSDIYFEYGLNPKWTVTTKVEQVRYKDASDFDSNAWRTTVRRSFQLGDGLVLSAEAGLLQGEAIGGFGNCSRIGAEIRAGAAWSGKFQKVDTFSYVEVAQRQHDGCTRALTELGIGRKATKNIWLITQAFLEEGGGLARSYKSQSSVLWAGRSFDLALGYRSEQGGVFEEDAVFISLARRF